MAFISNRCSTDKFISKMIVIVSFESSSHVIYYRIDCSNENNETWKNKPNILERGKK